uniref:Uncharacterized protein n=1 Tax=Cacopsylla melanoneura TaxID=428564 RepID=A0A8D8XEX0_9HEMI
MKSFVLKTGKSNSFSNPHSPTHSARGMCVPGRCVCQSIIRILGIRFSTWMSKMMMCGCVVFLKLEPHGPKRWPGASLMIWTSKVPKFSCQKDFLSLNILPYLTTVITSRCNSKCCPPMYSTR